MPKIQMRRDTAANWKSVNPILAAGEWGVETDTTKTKVGDGVTHYNDLDYIREEDNEWEKPSEWIDIRSGALPNSVYFLVGTGQRWGNMRELYTFDQQGNLTGASEHVYLKSDGNQYIDTGLKSSSSLSVEVEFRPNDSANLLGFFGSPDGINKSFSIAGMNATPFLRIGAGTASGNTAYKALSFNNLTMGNSFSSCTINGNGMNSDGGIGSSTFTDGGNIWLFGINGASGPSSFMIKRAKFRDNGILVRDFVPVPSGMVIGSQTIHSNGMFDIVNQQFYGNSGTGSFTFGIDDEPGATDYQTFSVHPTISNSGTYDVYVDGIKQATTASGTATTLDWGLLNLVSGWDVTYPTALKTHIVRITPSNSTDTSTIKKIYTDLGVANTNLGTLWIHFLTSEYLDLAYLAGEPNLSKSPILECITSASNELKVSSLQCAFRWNSESLKSLPIFVHDGVSSYGVLLDSAFPGAYDLKYLKFKNFNAHGTEYFLNSVRSLKRLDSDKALPLSIQSFFGASSLKKLPSLKYNSYGTYTSTLSNILYHCTSLKNTGLDLSDFVDTKTLTIGGDYNNQIKGLRYIVVSPEAPFDYATSPQLNVSYTGLTQGALVNLFKSMPYNVTYEKFGSPTIVDGVVSGFNGSNYLQLTNSVDYNKNFEVELAFTMPDSGRNFALISRGGNHVGGITLICTYNEIHHLRLFDKTGTQVEDFSFSYLHTLAYNTSYIFNIKRDGNDYTVTLKYPNGTVLYSETRTAATEIDYGNNCRAAFGVNKTNSIYTPFQGSIDLNQTYIKVNGLPFFGPGVTKNLVPGGTVVGSPTVTNGIASGFSSSKYVKSDIPTDFTKYELVTRIKTPSSAPSTHRHVIGCLETNWTNLGFTLQTDMTLSGRFVYLNSNNTKVFAHIDTAALDTNAYYFVKYEIDLEEGTRKFSYSVDGSTWVTNQQSIGSGQTQVYDSVISFGWGANYSEFTGSIDLNNTYIKVDNSYVYRGMVPQVKTVSVVGCPGTSGWNQTVGADVRAIALNKGWEVSY